MKLLDLDVPAQDMSVDEIDNLKRAYRSLSRKEMAQRKTIRDMHIENRELKAKIKALESKLKTNTNAK